ARQGGAEDARGLPGRKLRRVGQQVAVVRGACARLDERPAALPKRGQVPLVVTGVDAGDLRERVQLAAPVRAVDVQQRVGTERRHHAVAPPLGREGRVLGEVRRGGVGGGDDLQADRKSVV